MHQHHCSAPFSLTQIRVERKKAKSFYISGEFFETVPDFPRLRHKSRLLDLAFLGCKSSYFPPFPTVPHVLSALKP
ncbi:hypothetical protein K1719_019911 [Acacia pycnantha]|nr:hypothetical protein K1719_019911 [Acacia pycnantha]